MRVNRYLLGSTLVAALGGLLFTMAAMLVIDHFGRRRLMLVGSFGYILSLTATAAAFYTYGTEFTTTGSIVVLVSLFYAVMMVLQLFWVLLIMPETKGVSLEQIQRELGIE